MQLRFMDEIGQRMFNDKPFYVLAIKRRINSIGYIGYAHTLLPEAKKAYRNERGSGWTEHLKLYHVHDGKYELIEEYKAT